MSVVVPERSLQQRMDALVKANDHRLRRAQLKRDVKAGSVCLLDVIEDPPAWALSMKLLDLLMAAPRVGRVKALKLISQHNISPVKTLGGLSYRQRDELTKAWIWGGR